MLNTNINGNVDIKDVQAAEKLNGFRSEEEYNEVLELTNRFNDSSIDTFSIYYDKERCIMEICLEDEHNLFTLSLFPEVDFELEVTLKEKDFKNGFVRMNSSWGCIGAIHQLIEMHLNGMFDFVFEED